MVVKTAYESRIYPVSVVKQAIQDENTNKNKFLRGAPADFESLKDKKLKGELKVREYLFTKSATTAANAEKYLLPSEGGYLETEGIERSDRIRQTAIAEEVDILSKRNQYDIVLPELGPYTMDITSNGRYMVASGRKGHLAVMDMKSLNILKEFQVNETVRDVAFLHNQKLFVTAQKKYVYMYNDQGTEVHCLKEIMYSTLRSNTIRESIVRDAGTTIEALGEVIEGYCRVKDLERSTRPTAQPERDHNQEGKREARNNHARLAPDLRHQITRRKAEDLDNPFKHPLKAVYFVIKDEPYVGPPPRKIHESQKTLRSLEYCDYHQQPEY